MRNVFSLLNCFFLPYLLMGGMGGILFIIYANTKKRKHLLVVLGCILIMLFWRLMINDLKSSRYGENILFITAIGSAYFLLNWTLFFRSKLSANAQKRLKRIVIFIVLTVLAICLFDYNKMLTNYYGIKENIEKHSNKENAAIITLKGQRLYEAGIPQKAIPSFLIQNNDSKWNMLRTLRHYEWYYDKLYVVTNWSPDSISLPENEKQRLKVQGKYYKSVNSKPYYLYKYQSPSLSVSLQQVKTPFDFDDKDNLFKNGGFETLRPRDKSGKEYYDKIYSQGVSKRNAIPSNRLFPSIWDIFWADGFSDKTKATIYATNEKAISGNYSFFLESSDTISFLSLEPFQASDYCFQCDILPLKKSTVGVQFSLRDENGKLVCFRKIQTVTLDRSLQLYHYALKIPREMFYPYPIFYFYFFLYDSGSVIVDNFSLQKLSASNI